MGLLTSVGPDGIANSGYAWTNQSTSFNSNKTLESGGPASSTTLNPALRRAYQAWSFDPLMASGTALSIGTTLAVLVYVPTNFVCSSIDFIGVANTGNTTAAIWPSTAPAGTANPLAWSAATAAVATSVNSLTFNGASSPASVTLTGGNSYFVTLFGAATAPTVAASPTLSNAAFLNAAPSGTFSVSTVYLTASVATLTTVSSSSVFGTSSFTPVSMPWVGLH
jgi:hypothetical protein